MLLADFIIGVNQVIISGFFTWLTINGKENNQADFIKGANRIARLVCPIYNG